MTPRRSLAPILDAADANRGDEHTPLVDPPAELPDLGNPVLERLGRGGQDGSSET